MPRSLGTQISIRSISGSDCPFLYQTRTILQQQQHRRSCKHRAASTSLPNPRRHALHDQAQGKAPQANQSFLKDKAAQVAFRKPKPVSSITPAEQAAFDNIWALFQKPSPSTPQARATSINYNDTDYKHILELFAPLPQQTNSQGTQSASPVPTPREQVAQQAAQSTPKDGSSTQLKLNRDRAMREIKSFLRETATPSTSASQLTDETQETTLRIVEDVADSLTTALASEILRPDIAMWRVVEEKIFPLVRLLRPSRRPLSSPIPVPNPSSPISPDAVTPQIHPLIPNGVPLLPLLSQTFPSLTLLILRLYATHHPTSPYALALLPTLKSLGPTSYVLGAHTHFYNTLLSLYWRMYSDLRGMNALLEEMDANGVEFDVGTWEVLGLVGADREGDLSGVGGGGQQESGNVGGRGKAWWSRLEQTIWWPRVGVQWRDVVGRRLEEKGILVREVLREDDQVLREGAGDVGEKSEYIVTL